MAAAVPVLISRAIEMFMTRLLQDAEKQILQRNARTLTPQHIKQAINSHQVFRRDSMFSEWVRQPADGDCVISIENNSALLNHVSNGKSCHDENIPII